MLSAIAQAVRERWSPRYVGLVVAPIAATLVAWALFMTTENLWALFPTHGFMTLTMVAGSFVAGVSSEGGGGWPTRR